MKPVRPLLSDSLGSRPLLETPGSSGQGRLRGRLSIPVCPTRECHYEAIYLCGALDRFGVDYREIFGARPGAIITDSTVSREYLPKLKASLALAGLECPVVTIPPGENSKNIETFSYIIEKLRSLGFPRRGVLVNFGGGVISDLGGFVASAYMRGVDYVNLSTTLIGQLDAAIGGKVAVNAPRAKNFIGAFHHPARVICDPNLIATLDAAEFRSGLGEAVKVAIISGPDLFERLERESNLVNQRDPMTLLGIIHRAAELKMELVAQDPYERDLRRSLNLGHTLGHPIESVFAYQGIRHGEAVAVGTTVATHIARQLRLIRDHDAGRIFALMDQYDLLSSIPAIPVPEVLAHLREIRMIRGGSLNFVLPSGIGSVVIKDELSDEVLQAGFDAFNRVGERPR